MPKFAVYLYDETDALSKPIEEISFVGYSIPYFMQVRQTLRGILADYPVLALRKADYSDFYKVHDQTYLDKIRLMADDQAVEEIPWLSMECRGFEYAIPGYLYGLGGMYEAIDQMKAGHLERAYCFSLGGHHGYADRGHGYCMLNPMAAAARYAQQNGFEKILIVDWDIHHGDGTQSIFAHDRSVYCISIHSGMDLYMAMARALRLGTTSAAEQAGHCNIPLVTASLPADMAERMSLPGKFYTADESLNVFRAALDNLPWIPDLLFIFSGYDSHKDDCGDGITNWTNDDFRQLTQDVLKLAKQAGCPVLSVHGGGYKLPIAVAAATAHVEILAHHD